MTQTTIPAKNQRFAEAIQEASNYCRNTLLCSDAMICPPREAGHPARVENEILIMIDPKDRDTVVVALFSDEAGTAQWKALVTLEELEAVR
jgi:hypothetical protein